MVRGAVSACPSSMSVASGVKAATAAATLLADFFREKDTTEPPLPSPSLNPLAPPSFIPCRAPLSPSLAPFVGSGLAGSGPGLVRSGPGLAVSWLGLTACLSGVVATVALPALVAVEAGAAWLVP